MAIIDLKQSTLTIRDGTPTTPLTLDVKIGQGTLTYSEKRTMEYRLNRGVLDTVRQGDQEALEVTFDFEWEFLRSVSGAPVTVEEALKQVGAASAWVSSSADACEPYAVDLVILYDPPCGTTKSESIVLPDFRWESLDHNVKDGQVACKGKCNATQALITRVSSSDVEQADSPTADVSKAVDRQQRRLEVIRNASRRTVPEEVPEVPTEVPA